MVALDNLGYIPIWNFILEQLIGVVHLDRTHHEFLEVFPKL